MTVVPEGLELRLFWNMLYRNFAGGDFLNENVLTMIFVAYSIHVELGFFETFSDVIRIFI